MPVSTRFTERLQQAKGLLQDNQADIYNLGDLKRCLINQDLSDEVEALETLLILNSTQRISRFKTLCQNITRFR